MIESIKKKYLDHHKESTLKHVEEVAEEKYHFLLHQRISRILAAEEFGIEEQDILDAIECHTTLKKNANMYDKVIFIADKISWDQKGLPPYYDELKSKVAESLEDACYFYIKYQFTTRLLEECGEVAKEVNRLEKSGTKVLRHGNGTKEDLASEIKDAMNALMQLAIYYDAVEQVQVAIAKSIEQLSQEGHIKGE